jgi:hypothetical protein
MKKSFLVLILSLLTIYTLQAQSAEDVKKINEKVAQVSTALKMNEAQTQKYRALVTKHIADKKELKEKIKNLPKDEQKAAKKKLKDAYEKDLKALLTNAQMKQLMKLKKEEDEKEEKR